MSKLFRFLCFSLFCTLTLSLTSCGDDNDELSEDVLESAIVGKWAQASTDDPEIAGEFTYIVFSSDHTGAFHFDDGVYDPSIDLPDDDYDEPHDFKWSLNGNTMTIEFGEPESHYYEVFVGTVKINGDMMTIDGTSKGYDAEGDTWYPVSWHQCFIVKKMK